MPVAYLILAHNNPVHFRRLLNALTSPTSAFFVHIDKKSTFDFAHDLSDGVVHFCEERFTVNWGDWSIVEATLALIQRVLSDPRQFNWLVLLSGADYPLRSSAYIERFFERNRSEEFINLVEMPSEAADKPISRLTIFRPNSSDCSIKRAGRRLLERLGIVPVERNYRKVFGDLVPYAGSQWWALSRDACEYIVRFVKTEPKIVRFFRNTSIPDEMFFQTILGNSSFKVRIQRNLTFADWSAGGPSPALISHKHIDLFAKTTSFSPDNLYGSGEMLFVRKFSDENQNVVTSLNQMILERDGCFIEY